MIRLYYISQYQQIKIDEVPANIDMNNLIWVDLYKPSEQEIKFIEDKFLIHFPTKQEQEEIESSSRYTEEIGQVKINSTFLSYDYANRSIVENELSFIITENYLFSLRYFDSKAITESVKRLKNNKETSITPEDLIVTIIENRIDLDADLIEAISRNIAALNINVSSSHNLNENIVLEINNFQHNIMLIREALFDKQRVVSAMLRTNKTIRANRENLRTVLKDINSLIEHSNFNFTRLEYMQNNLMGLINIEQNKVIKLFTVATVVFMPPTLIASIYGMNFKIMPELEWMLGYPFAIFLMVFSSVFTLYYFKKKKWL